MITSPLCGRLLTCNSLVLVAVFSLLVAHPGRMFESASKAVSGTSPLSIEPKADNPRRELPRGERKAFGADARV